LPYYITVSGGLLIINLWSWYSHNCSTRASRIRRETYSTIRVIRGGGEERERRESTALRKALVGIVSFLFYSGELGAP